MEFKDYLKQQAKIKHQNELNRFEKYDAIVEFYDKNPKKSWKDLNEFTKGNSKVLFENKIKELNSKGFKAAEVNGNSQDRAEILEDFDKGKYNVLCNSMLLTEGWDCPSVDCVVVLRPTKVRSLYAQMVGRGTRLFPGKDHLLLLDFLWHVEKHELCHPAHLICENQEVAQKMTENIEEAGFPIDII